jgi:DNA processing protein
MIDERLARLALSRLGEPGSLRMALLASELGPGRLHAELLAGRDAEGLRSDMAARLDDMDPERDLERASRLGIRWIVPGDAEWPSPLDELDGAEPLQSMSGAPLGLWVRGPVHLDALTAPVAVVGSRSATTYGTQVASELAAGLVRSGSAVLDHLAEHGAVVSELAPGCAPTRLRFLARNRIIAGMSRGTVVVEAAARSGALNTASWTLRLNRSLMGVPGPVTSAPSEGVHQLIRSGAATLVTRADDVLELTGAIGEHVAEPPRGPTTARDTLTRRQQQVLEAVPLVRPAPSDSVARTAGLGLVQVRSALDGLARRGLVEQLPTGWRLAEPADEGGIKG